MHAEKLKKFLLQQEDFLSSALDGSVLDIPELSDSVYLNSTQSS